MRSPANMDILQIDVHNKCFLACSNCTRLIAHQPKKWEMDVPTFTKAVESLQDWYVQGKVAGMIAGEPTLHSQFENLCHAFADNFGGPKTTHGRKPIADFNAFAVQRLHDRSNGRGLWTSFGPGYYRHYEVIQDVFSHLNPNDHTAGGKHQSLLINRKDYCEQTGTSDDEWLRKRDACWVQNSWSGSINDKGAYPCEVMAAIDRLYYDGTHAWKVEPGWWKRKPEDFGDMLDLCNHCALAQIGPSQVDTVERDIISTTEVENLTRIGSPAVKRGQYDLYQIELHDEKRQVTTKDSYAGDWRVGAENRSMFPKKLTLVVVCVGRAEHLRKTLNHNAALVDEMIIVSHPDDTETTRMFHGAITHPKIRVIRSPRCFDDHHAFNKGKMLNDGIAAIEKPDWIILSDADIFLNPETLKYIKSHALNPGVLYGTTRLDLVNDAEVTLFEKLGMLPERRLHGKIDEQPNGFLQLFHPRAFAIRDRFPKVMAETFCSAGGVDSCFLQQWPADKRVQIPELAVAHIHHGEKLGDGWNGKDRPTVGHSSGRWEQCGVIQMSENPALTGYLGFGGVPLWPTALYRCTETMTGESIELKFGMEDVPITITTKGILFNGRNIGKHHVHVAVWREGT